MLSEKEKSNIKAIEEILFRNKVGNYSIAPMRLLAYIVVVYGEEHVPVIELSYQAEWIKNNFTKIQFVRSISFLKTKDLLQRKGSQTIIRYKVNFRYLKNIVVDELDIDALLEINRFFKQRKRKLRVKKLKTSGAKNKPTVQPLSCLYRNNKNNRTNRKLDDDEDLDVGKLDDTKMMTHSQSTLESGSFMSSLKERKKRKGGKRIRKDSTELYGQYKFNPSENPKLRAWQEREVEDWRSIDFLGYYICSYKEETGLENIALQNDQAYLKVKKMIRAMLQQWFNNNRELMRDYLKWAVGYFTHEMNGRYSPSIETLLNPYRQSRWVYDLFVKNKSKKGKRRKDNKWASDKSWG